MNDEREVDSEEEEMRVRQLTRKVTYHMRKKEKIEAKIDGLVDNKKQ